MRPLRSRLSYANVMSTIAVFGVLGGGAFAASAIGPQQIKRDAVRTKHLKNRGVNTRDLAPGSVKPARLAGGAVHGGKLADGAVTSSKLGTIITRSHPFTVGAGQVQSGTTSCGPTETLLGGGGDTPGAGSDVAIVDSYPGFEMTQQIWTVRAENTTGANAIANVRVFCLQ